MKREKYKWHFLRFLLEAKAYKAFIDNVESDENLFRKKYDFKSLKGFLDNFPPREWIGYGFLWVDTKEGKDFWRKLFVEWQVRVDDLDKL